MMRANLQRLNVCWAEKFVLWSKTLCSGKKNARLGGKFHVRKFCVRIFFQTKVSTHAWNTVCMCCVCK
jgi:hypothetical protein